MKKSSYQILKLKRENKSSVAYWKIWLAIQSMHIRLPSPSSTWSWIKHLSSCINSCMAIPHGMRLRIRLVHRHALRPSSCSASSQDKKNKAKSTPSTNLSSRSWESLTSKIKNTSKTKKYSKHSPIHLLPSNSWSPSSMGINCIRLSKFSPRPKSQKSSLRKMLPSMTTSEK